MSITHSEAFDMLAQKDNILILTHRNPDGDAVGSMFALYYVLKNMGKNVRCIAGNISKAYAFVVDEEAFSEFEEDVVVTVDVGDIKLLEEKCIINYADDIFLSIDHHESCVPFAKNVLLDSTAAAACEVIFDMLQEKNIEITQKIAQALYLGISTDTGCFRYKNATAHTLYAASVLIDKGVDNGEINRIVFETKSKNYVRFETLCMNSLRMFLDDKCAMMIVTQDMLKKTNVKEEEIFAITALPRQIEGVLAGVVMKERKSGTYKISVRTNEPLSAADICASLGGGGHRLAAGCELSGRETEVRNIILKAVEKEIKSL